MAVASVSVTVATTATLLSGTDPGDSQGAANGQSVTVRVPSGGATVYLGGSNVSTSNGFPLAATESFSMDCLPGDALYGVVAASTQAVNVLRSDV